MSYKISQQDKLVADLQKKGLNVIRKYDTDDQQRVEVYLKVFEKDQLIGDIEPGNKDWELVCYSIESEKLARKYNLINLVGKYWPWFRN